MQKIILLQEIIDDLVNPETSLSSPLIKLNYFSKLIRNEDLISYTNNELNGYTQDLNEIPSYRRASATILIDFQVSTHRHNNKQLPIILLEKDHQEYFNYIYIKEGIAVIEDFVKDSFSDHNYEKLYVMPIPMEILPALQEPARKLYKAFSRVDVVNANLTTNFSSVIAIPNAIRVRLLDFVMSIAEDFGDKLEIESFNKKSTENNKTIINHMNTTINNSGDGNVINTGNENEIDNKVTLYKGDIQRLKKELLNHGIEENDISELNKIITSEEPNREHNRLGVKSIDWISNIIKKSLNGVGKIASGISSTILAELIKQYYGM